MENNLLKQEIDKFNSRFATETNIRTFLLILKDIASRFTFVEEDTTLNGSFNTILTLVEQYKHELIAGYNDS
jgi:hypothetical protein